MKIYLPGYYLRSLRNKPLLEIDADDINTTIQQHQDEEQKSRTNRNLKAFEAITKSRSKNDKKESKEVSKQKDVPLVQEFIRNSTGEAENAENITTEFSLTQTLESIPECDVGNVENFPCNHSTLGYEFIAPHSSVIFNSIYSQPLIIASSHHSYQSMQAPISTIPSMTSVPRISNMRYPEIYSSSETHFPKVFKAKLKRNLSVRNSTLKTPNINAARITNLSYSQPASPKTPLVRSFVCATPRIQKSKNISTPSLSQCVPFTPMLQEAVKLLDNFPERNEENVDLLNIIDDDTKPVELVDKELDMYSEVNDANIADYVLNFVNDYPINEEPTFEKVLKPDFSKRKCHHAKPIFLEESEAYKEQRRQKDRERRKKKKEMFQKKSPLGTRRSNRKLRAPPPRV